VDKNIFKHLLPDGFRLFFVAVIFVFLFLLIVCLFFDPRWETNDDIAMSMVAHGYGLAAYSSPNIIFSNVLWGYFVRLVPTVDGILGYSIATLLSLFAAGVSIFYFSAKLGVGWAVSAAITATALLRPTLFPQFTLNAALLTIGAVLGLAYYAQTKKYSVLAAILALGFFGFLIRSQQFLIVLIVSLPFLKFNLLKKDSRFWIFCITLLSLILFAIGFDWLSYTGTEWNRFFEINAARAPYTDFGLADQLKTHPKIINEYGYTTNDLDLIRSFFFSDPVITRPELLNAMASDLGALPFFTANMPLAVDSVKGLSSLNILPITLLTLVLFVLRPSVKVVIAFFFIVAFAFLMGLIGRGGLERVLAPLITLLAIFSMIHLWDSKIKNHAFIDAGKLHGLTLGLTMVALMASLWVAYPQATLARSQITLAQDEAINYPDTLLFSWGVGIRIESIFPLLANKNSFQKMQIYGLGVFTHAPFSRAHLEEADGKGLVQRIRSPGGIFIVASESNIDLLKTWCRERYSAILRDEIIHSGQMTVLKRVRCE
jgi:hypothetical protein